jgi:hydroxymethylpyrimidine pyrophosphatase-like HAD family hydrolase
MVQNAGIGVAMANASPLLLQTARSITLSNDQEGVGKYLEATLLKEEASR